MVEKPTAVASELGQVLDIAATWHSSLNVCCTKSGVYFWGTWLGQEWKCPSPSNFTSMDLVFTVEKGQFHESIMCRPLLMPEPEASLTSGFSEHFNTPVSIATNFLPFCFTVGSKNFVFHAFHSFLFRPLVMYSLRCKAPRNLCRPSCAHIPIPLL